uniref:Putative HD phosphohydrolase n=1 Tax=blood disease bacterium R229 TaxID=741978 RepID=G2ZNU9_9RALS|nr:putative HD phosphohydrolase [blood disease bacterium R229]
MALRFDDLRTLFDRHGDIAYSGEPVTRRAHALQAAALAEAAGASDALITAALLHDLGHLLNPQGETPTGRGIDDPHPYFALPFLRGVFPRCRARTDSPARGCQALPVRHRRALPRVLVGRFGTQPRAAGRGVLRCPYAADVLCLRRWDDLAKVAGRPTPDLSHFLAVAARVSKAA